MFSDILHHSTGSPNCCAVGTGLSKQALKLEWSRGFCIAKYAVQAGCGDINSKSSVQQWEIVNIILYMRVGIYMLYLESAASNYPAAFADHFSQSSRSFCNSWSQFPPKDGMNYKSEIPFWEGSTWFILERSKHGISHKHTLRWCIHGIATTADIPAASGTLARGGASWLKTIYKQGPYSKNKNA